MSSASPKCLLLLFALGLPLTMSAGFRPGPGWPEVSTPFHHASTQAQVELRLAAWRQQPGCIISNYRDTGSMRPVLSGGRELLVMEVCRPETPLETGQIVQFNRGDSPATLHYIADISADGQRLYLSGVHNRYSDGWFSRNTVAYVVREIITVPDNVTAPNAEAGLLAANAPAPVGQR
jgi:hypothetical protein